MDDQKILEKLDARIQDIQSGIAEIRMIYDAHSRRLDRLDQCVFGNGKPGIAMQIRAVLWIASGCLGFVAFIAAETIAQMFH